MKEFEILEVLGGGASVEEGGVKGYDVTSGWHCWNKQVKTDQTCRLLSYVSLPSLHRSYHICIESLKPKVC